MGQEAPLAAKQHWDADFARRRRIKAVLDGLIPHFAVHLDGATSIDVARAGIDKSHGIRKLGDILHIPIADMIFIGDALFPGGNDYPAKEAGARSIRVGSPQEAKQVIDTLLACLQED